MMNEGFLAFLHRDGIDHRLALNAFQTGLDHLPFGAVDHDRHAGDIRLGSDQIEEFDHRLFGIDQAFIHVDIDNLGAIDHLIARDIKSGGKVTGLDQLAEPGRAGDVGALTDIDEGNILGQREGLKTRKAHQRRDLAGLRGGCFATASAMARICSGVEPQHPDHIDQTITRKVFDLRSHCFRRFVILAELVRQAGIRIGADKRISDVRQFVEMGAHGVCAERAIETDSKRLGVTQRVPESRWRLAGQGAAGKIGDRAGNHHRQEDALSSNTCSDAKTAALAFSVSKMVSIRMMSEPPSISPGFARHRQCADRRR